MTVASLVLANNALSQGDIVVAPISRTTARFHSPDRWDRLDEYEVTVPSSSVSAGLQVFAGCAVLMVTSHDCHHDKEWNEEVARLIRSGVTPADAGEQAATNENLDRTFQASPLVPLDDFPPTKRNGLHRGQTVGYLPVPDNLDLGIPPSVVDLTYRVTIDRLSIERRICGLNEPGRGQLRLALARFDALRSVSLGFDIETVVGRQITDVQVTKGNAIEIVLTLDNGESLRFLQQPAEPSAGGRPGL